MALSLVWRRSHLAQPYPGTRLETTTVTHVRVRDLTGKSAATVEVRRGDAMEIFRFGADGWADLGAATRELEVDDYGPRGAIWDSGPIDLRLVLKNAAGEVVGTALLFRVTDGPGTGH